MAPWRAAAAVAILLVGIALVAVVATHRPASEAPEGVLDPLTLVREVVTRQGAAPGVVTAETGDGITVVTVHATPGFEVHGFLLALEAAAHNAGGRLEPRPLTERGGYGLAAMEGVLGEKRVRVLVLGEAAATPAPPVAHPGPTTARLAIILDDGGNSLDPIPAIEALPSEIAVAVLPDVPFSSQFAASLAADGREVLLHMPMEPLPGAEPGPGPGAIMVGMDAGAVGIALSRALQAVPQAVGVNNHMGSRATADRATMAEVMAELRRRGLYFLDSRTTPQTVAQTVAIEDGVPALRRDVFLDVVGEKNAVRRSLAEAVRRAQRNGSAVAIGHVHPVTLEVLREEARGLLREVRLVRPSALLERG